MNDVQVKTCFDTCEIMAKKLGLSINIPRDQVIFQIKSTSGDILFESNSIFTICDFLKGFHKAESITTHMFETAIVKAERSTYHKFLDVHEDILVITRDMIAQIKKYKRENNGI